MKPGLISPSYRPTLANTAGLVVVLISVLAPALPLGPLAASPPMPMAALWAAYGWSADPRGGFRAPAALLLIGLLQDQLNGGPLGLYALVYLLAFLIGSVVARATASLSFVTAWAGFAGVTAAVGLAYLTLAPTLTGQAAGVSAYAWAGLVTVLLYPLARPLFQPQSAQGSTR